MTRSEACKFLSVQLGIEQKDAHISRFDIYECIKIIDGITKPYAAYTAIVAARAEYAAACLVVVQQRRGFYNTRKGRTD